MDALGLSSAGSKGKPEAQGANGWWATTWQPIDAVGFYGKPVPTTATHSRTGTVTIRYTYYATEYDAVRHTPVWAAYSVDRDAVAADFSGKRTASNPDFERPKFFRDPLLKTFSDRLNVDSATHETFGDAMHPSYPISASLSEPQARAKPEFLERGHMVPNNAMKSSGSYEEG